MTSEKSPLQHLCEKLEHFETPQWAIEAILDNEILTRLVLDVACGDMRIAFEAETRGYHTRTLDIYQWRAEMPDYLIDFLSHDEESRISLQGFLQNENVIMNPPFSKAEAFVEKAFELGARKVLCFQRFAWWESKKRRKFWDRFPPTKVYVCGERADCWRHDIPADKRGSGTPTAHAWFCFERKHRGGTLLDRIYKPEKVAT